MKPIAVVALLVAVSMSSCTTDGGTVDATGASLNPASSPVSPQSSPQMRNAADDSFVIGMIIYRRQALAMLPLAATRTKDAGISRLVYDLAQACKADEQRLLQLLDKWGQPHPASTSILEDRPALPGTVSQQHIDELTNLSGSSFDDRFLMLLTGNIRGTVRLADLENAAGVSTDARQLALSVAGTGTALLGSIGSRVIQPTNG